MHFMKKLVPITIIILVLSSFKFMQQKERIIFFGDSITQAAVQPIGFITLIGSKLTQDGKADKYELIGAGISGNKVYDLYLRLEDDVLAKNPNTVVIYIGANDVWHKTTGGTGTDADKFERFYTAIINKLKAKNIKIVLCTPATIGEKTDNTNLQDGDMNRYSNIVRDLAQKNDLPLIDLRKVFLDYDRVNNKENKDRGILTRDGVHLNEKGNQLVAEELLKVLVK